MVGKYLMRITIVLVVALISWAVYVSSKQLARNQRIEEEVRSLEQEADKIRRENETLSEKIQYFASNDFREQEAKEKLGMKKAGEEVVVVQSWQTEEGEEKASKMTPETSLTQQAGETLPSYKKWWYLFFGPS
jgi:cell division protein FtsB